MLGQLGGLSARRGFQTASALRRAYPYKLAYDTAAAPPSEEPGVKFTALKFANPAGNKPFDDRATIGWLTDDKHPAKPCAQIDVRHFVANGVFWKEEVAKAYKQHAHEDPELQAQAAFQKTGWMTIADGRNPPPLGRIGDPEDILGAVCLDEQAAIVPESFEVNDMHRAVTPAHGLFQLSEYMQTKLLERLSLPSEPKKPGDCGDPENGD